VARAAAFDDARALAVEISRGVPSLHFDAMSAGLVLSPEDSPYRWVGAWLAVQDAGSWATPSWTQILITDQRLLCCLDGGRLLALRWPEVTAVQIALDQHRLLLNYRDHSPIAFMGGAVVVLAVATVAGVYGAPGLLTHPALSSLRHRVSGVAGQGNYDGRA
jgi:hypothetical protein